MGDALLSTYAFNLTYAKKLAEGIPEALACRRPPGIPNHAAWVFGHLATSTDFAGTLLDVPPVCPETWGGLFGKDSVPTEQRSRYPDLEEILTKLGEGHDGVVNAYTAASADRLALPATVGPIKLFPQVGSLLGFLMTSHEALHLGQLSAWRRGMGLGSAF